MKPDSRKSWESWQKNAHLRWREQTGLWVVVWKFLGIDLLLRTDIHRNSHWLLLSTCFFFYGVFGFIPLWRSSRRNLISSSRNHWATKIKRQESMNGLTDFSLWRVPLLDNAKREQTPYISTIKLLKSVNI